jgi:hypothetical protein
MLVLLMGGGLRRTLLRWAQVPRHIYQVSQRLVQAFKSCWWGTHRQQSDLISALLYFQNKESRLKTDRYHEPLEDRHEEMLYISDFEVLARNICEEFLETIIKFL